MSGATNWGGSSAPRGEAIKAIGGSPPARPAARDEQRFVDGSEAERQQRIDALLGQRLDRVGQLDRQLQEKQPHGRRERRGDAAQATLVHRGIRRVRGQGVLAEQVVDRGLGVVDAAQGGPSLVAAAWSGTGSKRSLLCRAGAWRLRIHYGVWSRRTVGRVRPLHDPVWELTARLCEQLDAEVGADRLHRLPRDRRVLVQVAEHAPDGRTFQLGRGFLVSQFPTTAEVLRGGQPSAVSLDDPAADQAEADVLRDLAVRAVLMLALRDGPVAWGLVELYRIEPSTFSPDEIERSVALVHHAEARLQAILELRRGAR